jgi:hypothetical protein
VGYSPSHCNGMSVSAEVGRLQHRIAHLDLLDPAWPARLRHAFAGRWSRHCSREWKGGDSDAVGCLVAVLGGRVSGVGEERRAGAVLEGRRASG